MRPVQLITQAFLAQYGQFFFWVPVCLGLGIGVYFKLSFEPALAVWISIGIATCLGGVLYWRGSPAVRPLIAAVMIISIGAGLAKWRTESLREHVLEYRFYGPVQGRVVNIDRSASDAVRLTLDQVVLSDMAPDRTPTRVRVSLHGAQPLARILPGDMLVMTAHLSPPSGPAEPGGFDFQRHAWFLELGGVGYTRTPVLRFLPPSEGWDLAIFRLRDRISEAIKHRLPADTAGIAVAITTGDRSAIAEDKLEDLRDANLAHLLAISGLHMGLLTGFIFTSLRYLLALHSGVALRWPVKKIAAVGALLAGLIYLALSGGNVATQRAFIMVGVMLVAVLLDRRALTLRAVAIAAIIVLVLRPEAILGPGFQMSFAATTALVVVFGWLRERDLGAKRRWTRALSQVIISSAVAGLATAPFAAAHFNQIAHYGLFANVLSVPVMGLLVMPAAVVAACLVPFGLAGVGLWAMDLGLRWILMIAEFTASRPGAVSYVKAPDAAVLPLLAVAALIFILWRGRARWAGPVLGVLGFGLWVATDRPVLLVADTGGFMGVLTGSGRDLTRETGHGFVAQIWLENDGNPVEQNIAAARDGIYAEGRKFSARLGDWTVLQVSGKTVLRELTGCNGADILISNQIEAGERPCVVIDQQDLRRLGSLAMHATSDGLVVKSTRYITGERPWNASSAITELPPRFIVPSKRAADAAQFVEK